jgi:hypothetical protein
MAEPTPIYVSRAEYEKEQAYLYELDSRLAELEARWDAFVTAHPDRLLVGREEFGREQEEIRLVRRQLSEEWSRWGHYASMRRWTLRRELPRASAAYLGLLRTSRTRVIEIQATIREASGEIEKKFVIPPEIAKLRAEIASVEAELNRERERFERKVVVELERVGTESCSGLDIYFDPSRSIYVVKHPQTKEIVREEDKICIELTASIKTEGGHDPITCEITVTTYVSNMGTSDLVGVEKEMEDGLKRWLNEQGLGFLLEAFEKVGVAYNGEKHVDEVKLYPYDVPDYPTAYIYLERRSVYIRLRTYEGEFKVG